MKFEIVKTERARADIIHRLKRDAETRAREYLRVRGANQIANAHSMKIRPGNTGVLRTPIIVEDGFRCPVTPANREPERFELVKVLTGERRQNLKKRVSYEILFHGCNIVYSQTKTIGNNDGQ